MKAYICMGIMCLACIFSFLVGKNVGAVQAKRQAEAQVLAMEHVQQGEQEAEELVSAKADDDETDSMAGNVMEEWPVRVESVSSGDGEKEVGKSQEAMQESRFSKEDKSGIVLVNKEHKLPEDYEVILKKLPDGTNQAATEAYQPMCDMLKAARKDGMILEVCSSYRSMKRQKELFEEDMRVLVGKGYSYLDAYEEVARETMPPGYSEHSTGLAFDIVALDYQMLNDKQEMTEENQWLREHCAEYGFILRYPKDKEDITGIDYESWHFRYVGVEIAEYIMEKGITLEEFLEE